MAILTHAVCVNPRKPVTHAGATRGMPLFLGAIKPRPPPQHSAVLAYRPEKLGKGVDAILALHPAAGGGEAVACPLKVAWSFKETGILCVLVESRHYAWVVDMQVQSRPLVEGHDLACMQICTCRCDRCPQRRDHVLHACKYAHVGAIAAPGGGTMFCFVAEGRLLALTGYNAMFHAVLSFLLYHKAKYNGALGLHYIQASLVFAFTF
eukprot:scaffold98563_cov24-Tisochrysis_lutea.AAC.1